MLDGMNMAFSADYFRNADYLVRVKAVLLRAVGALPPHPQNVRCAPVSLRICAKETGAAVPPYAAKLMLRSACRPTAGMQQPCGLRVASSLAGHAIAAQTD